MFSEFAKLAIVRATLQIIREVGPNVDPAVTKLPPLMLDWPGPDYITKDGFSQGETMFLAHPRK